MHPSHQNDDDEKPPPPPAPQPSSHGQHPPQGQPVSGPPPYDHHHSANGPPTETVPSPSDPSLKAGKHETSPPPYDANDPPIAYPPPPPAYPPPPSNQYVVGVPPLHYSGHRAPWSTGFFDCFDDVPTFCITCFCPCVTYGQVAEIVDRGAIHCGVHCGFYAIVMYFTGLGCIMSSFYRIKMSRQFNLDSNPLLDILVHLLCEPCALCQEYRELQAHGFDMNLGVGWKGNMEMQQQQQQQGMMIPPMPPGGMTR